MSKKVIEHTTRVTLGFGTLMWVSGWVFAQGFWSTFFSIIFPPWAWYLTLDILYRYWGVING